MKKVIIVLLTICSLPLFGITREKMEQQGICDPLQKEIWDTQDQLLETEKHLNETWPWDRNERNRLTNKKKSLESKLLELRSEYNIECSNY